MIESVFRNENFIVCNKPANVLSVPAREKSDPRPCLGLELQKELKRNVFPVHRLDFEVSGLILFALNSEAHKVSQDWFLKKTIRKMYVAETSLVQDFAHWPKSIPTDRTVINPEPGQKFLWKTKILRGKKRSFESENGEWAETEAHVWQIHPESQRLLWHLFPLTGKPHQLRLELARRGFPIVGDTLYGSVLKLNEPGIKLKAVQLDLTAVSERLGLPEKIDL